MNFSRNFNIFSKRYKSFGKASKQLTLKFKNRMVLLVNETFPRYDRGLGGLQESCFWGETHRNLQESLGELHLSSRRTSSAYEDIHNFFSECTNEQFLYFVELIFLSNQLWNPTARVDVVELLMKINEFFEADDIPYFLTGFVISPSPPALRSGSSLTVESYPQIILRESEVLHQTAIEPTLNLLTHPAFKSANNEFREALADYRRGDFLDCVTKCGSSFESVMKIICDQKGWPYQQTDTAATLLNKIFTNTTLKPFFKDPIILIATMRNRLSSAHGAGTQSPIVPKHVCGFAINTTAAAILLLVEETNP